MKKGKSSVNAQLRKLKSHDKVELVWLDAYAPGDTGWHDQETLDDWATGEFLIQEIGYVVSLDAGYLTLVGAYTMNDDYVSQYHREIRIPRAWIKSLKVLK